MVSEEKGRPIVFISYSHKDKRWRGRLRPHLELMERAGRIVLWDDHEINAGTEWYEKLQAVMSEAAVAVCLISADYLSSEFCTKEEIPYLLERRKQDGMALVLVLVRPCLWEAVDWLRTLQMLPGENKSVAEDFKGKTDSVLRDIVGHIYRIINDPDFQPAVGRTPDWPALSEQYVSIERLPTTGSELFGRTTEMAMLDAAWEEDATHVVSLVAWGGVGKSTLVNKWLERMAADNYRGAQRVYGWSFYSQGTGERVTSADVFMAQTLAWFGDPDPSLGTSWEKGQRLADLVRRQRTLLILDGLEPLQFGLEDMEQGRIKDAALATLIPVLAKHNVGLCVITTRQRVADLAPFQHTTLRRDLEQISDGAGRALLRVSGVRGKDHELESATRNFGNHALALKLLGRYLHEIPGDSIAHSDAIPDLEIPEHRGRYPRRVMQAFEAYFGPGAEVELLRVLGLFDRPAEPGAISAVCAAPPIRDLSEHLAGLSEGRWSLLVERLRDLGLVAPRSTHRPEDLDAHPLVREHFAEQLQEERHRDAWREGNRRLYEYLAAQPEKWLPDTLEEMAPLFPAVVHGCRAGRHQEVFEEVYVKRMWRDRTRHYSTRDLGAIGAELAAVASFFESLWDRPSDNLSGSYRAEMLRSAGFLLHALGRLPKAVQAMEAGKMAEAGIRGSKMSQAEAALYLSEMCMVLGELPRSLAFAQESVALAAQCEGAEFWRVSAQAQEAAVLHELGRPTAEAASVFEHALHSKGEWRPDYPQLSSLAGFHYLKFALDQIQAMAAGWAETSPEPLRALDSQRLASDAAEAQAGPSMLLDRLRAVRGQAEKTLEDTLLLSSDDDMEWVSRYPRRDGPLYQLILGRARLLGRSLGGSVGPESANENLARASEHLVLAVNGLREGGMRHLLPRGLLWRAAFHRERHDLEHVEDDLAEAMQIADQGGMKLYVVDGHLEYVRLHLARNELARAEKSLAEARALMQATDYHRPDREVEALAASCARPESGLANQGDP